MPAAYVENRSQKIHRDHLEVRNNVGVRWLLHLFCCSDKVLKVQIDEKHMAPKGAFFPCLCRSIHFFSFGFGVIGKS